jgi:hypothetical protein
MPKTTNRLYHSFAVTRGEIQEASKTLENQIFFETSENVYISRIEQIDSAQNEGDRISDEYDRLLSRWSEIPTKNKIKEHANTHYDYAVHLASLRMYYHFLSEQTELPTEKQRFLTESLNKSTLSLEQIEEAYDLYTEQDDREVTQHYMNDYTVCHNTIHSELQKLERKSRLSVEIPNEVNKDDRSAYSSSSCASTLDTPTLDRFLRMHNLPKKRSDFSTNSTTTTTSSTTSINLDDFSSVTSGYSSTFSFFNEKNNKNALPRVMTPYSVLRKRSRTTDGTKESSASTSSKKTDFTTTPSTR